jgi:hypothetical protein
MLRNRRETYGAGFTKSGIRGLETPAGAGGCKPDMEDLSVVGEKPGAGRDGAGRPEVSPPNQARHNYPGS